MFLATIRRDLVGWIRNENGHARRRFQVFIDLFHFAGPPLQVNIGHGTYPCGQARGERRLFGSIVSRNEIRPTRFPSVQDESDDSCDQKSSPGSSSRNRSNHGNAPEWCSRCWCPSYRSGSFGCYSNWNFGRRRNLNFGRCRYCCDSYRRS